MQVLGTGVAVEAGTRRFWVVGLLFGYWDCCGSGDMQVLGTGTAVEAETRVALGIGVAVEAATHTQVLGIGVAVKAATHTQVLAIGVAGLLWKWGHTWFSVVGFLQPYISYARMRMWLHVLCRA